MGLVVNVADIASERDAVNKSETCLLMPQYIVILLFTFHLFRKALDEHKNCRRNAQVPLSRSDNVMKMYNNVFCVRQEVR